MEEERIQNESYEAEQRVYRNLVFPSGIKKPALSLLPR